MGGGGILPIWMEISPIAHVALLQTEMNSGLRLVPNIGMKSARKKKKLLNYVLKLLNSSVLCFKRNLPDGNWNLDKI